MAYKMILRGDVGNTERIRKIVPPSKNSMPAVGVSWGSRDRSVRRKGDGEYVSGLAEYSGDPSAFCATRHEAKEKMKRKGLLFEST